MRDTLFLASESQARQQLLKLAGINFIVIPHHSDENLALPPKNITDNVLQIAKEKMRSLVLPNKNGYQKNHLFALTADTLIFDPRTKEILAKPKNRDDALRMLKLESLGVIIVATGVAVEKFFWQENAWQKNDARHFSVCTEIEFYVDDTKTYLQELPVAHKCSGAGVIEGHGLSYLKSINGSYTAAMGLPLYEVRMHLLEMGFKA